MRRRAASRPAASSRISAAKPCAHSALERAGAQLRDGITQVQPQRGEHLVVARASEVNAPTGGAAACGQVSLERGLTVLVGELDVPRATCVLGGESAER